MKNFSSASVGSRSLRAAALAVGLLGSATAAHAQASSIYALGIFTGAAGQYATGTQVLSAITPSSPAVTALTTINGVLGGQQLVGLDVRPNTGQLYALGYNNTLATNNAQLYVLNITNTNGSLTAVTAVPVGGAANTFTLNLGTSNRTDLNGYNLVVGVGFDFNPRADRIRVTGQNRLNLRLNPNNGTIVANDATLTYAATGNAVTPPSPPLIGAVAYANSALGLTGTTLYDIDQTPNNGVLATQSIVATGTVTTGTLTAQANISLTGTSGTFGIGDANFDLDIYTDPTTKQNSAYLFELTGPTAGSKGSSNLYSLNTSTGNAVRLGNIVGASVLRYTNIAAAPAPAPDVWTGAVSTDWATPGNWSTGMVPTSGVDAFIPGPSASVPNQPTVSGTAQQVRSVALGVGDTGQPAVLTLASGGTLSVFGNFVNNDGSVAGTGTVALVGPATQDITGASLSRFPNLSVGASGASTSGPAAVVGGLTLNGNLNIGNNQPFTLLSSASGTAYVVNTSGTVTGTATVQRYITPTNNGPGYRHYSTPVSGNTVADFTTADFSPVVNPAYNTSATPPTTTPFPNIYTYDQARLSLTNSSPEFDKGFQSPAATSEALALATGYAVNINATALVDFQGMLNNGTYTRSNLARGPQNSAGWQFLGNPYPSAVDYNVLLSNSTGIENALFVYKSNGQYTGTYTSYVNGKGANSGTNVLPLGQGFFVRTAAGQTGTVNFTNAARTNAPETALFQRTAADPRPTLALTLRNASIANQARVYFEQGATAAFDAKFDAHYLPATHGLDLASDISTEALAINGLPELAGATTVPLRVRARTAGTYTLAVDELANLPAGYRAYLRDASTGSYTDLTTTPSVSLELTAGEAPTGRFALLFTSASPLATAPAALAALAAVYPSPAHGTATLVLPQALRGNSASTVQLLNSLGQVVLTKTVAAGSGITIELPLAGIAAGIYTVRATTEAGLVAKRLVIQ